MVVAFDGGLSSVSDCDSGQVLREQYLRSQNHSMLGVGMDLCGPSSPIPLSKQGRLQQAAQGCVQADLEYLQRRRLHNNSGQPVPHSK